jgi:uncharacterized protein
MTTTTLADRFVEALEAADVDALRALLAPDARFWINIGPTDLSADQRLAVLETERAHLSALALVETRVLPTADGFVVQFTTQGTTIDGAELHIPVCLVVTVGAAGTIQRVDEYADSAPAKPLLRSMSGGTR